MAEFYSALLVPLHVHATSSEVHGFLAALQKQLHHLLERSQQEETNVCKLSIYT